MPLNRISVLVAPVLIGLLFATTLMGIDRLAFRDVGHFYTPLYDYLGKRTSEQWLPLWNPLDQTGMPVVGETTTALFYPVRYVLFRLPVATEVAMAWYVVLHLVLASLAAWFCARSCGITRAGAAVASLLYPLSGSVLFLCTNPPFLVGAAWLPFVLAAFLGRRRRPFSHRILIAGVALAMMILAGDPQTALHAMLIAAAVSLTRLCRKTPRQGASIALLIAAPMLAAALAAPQLAGSLAWALQSSRVATSARVSGNALLDPPDVAGRRYEAFQFSLPPWHCAEVLTPNAFGSPLPIHRRISSALPGEGRMWTPSIYLGMLTAIALLTRLVGVRRFGVDAWLLIAIASLLLSMGHYGVVWWIQNASGSWTHIDSAVGGPYWFLYHFLPGYDAFRYPAKWLPCFSLAASMITARWLTRDAWRSTVTTRHVMLLLVVLLTVASSVVLVLRLSPQLIGGAAGNVASIDRFWGPLDVSGALSQIQRSLLHSVLTVGAITLIVRLYLRKRLNRKSMVASLFAVLLLDLGIYSPAMIAKIPRVNERELLTRLEQRVTPPTSANSPQDAERWMRTQKHGGWPSSWRQQRDPNRLLDVEVSGRHAWFGRWHLARGQAVVNNMASIENWRMGFFWDAANQATSGMTTRQRDQFWQSIKRWLAAGGSVHTSDETVWLDQSALVQVHRRKQAVPPVQFQNRWMKSESISVESIAQLLGDIHRQGTRAIARVEYEGPLPQSPAPDSGDSAPGSGDSAQGNSKLPTVTRSPSRDSSPEWAEFLIDADRAGLLTRPVIQDGGWRAWYAGGESDSWRPLTVHSVDLIKQGVFVPAGQGKVRFRYRPAWVNWALPLSVATWIACLWWLCRRTRLGRRGILRA